MYLLVPSIFDENLIDFRPDEAVAPVLFGLIYFSEKKNMFGFILLIIILLGLKMNFCFILSGLGLSLFF